MRTSGLLVIFLSALLVRESSLADVVEDEYEHSAVTKKPKLDCNSGFLQICQIPALVDKCGKREECVGMEVAMLSMRDYDADSSVAIEGVDRRGKRALEAS